jgi:hypothetical protein
MPDLMESIGALILSFFVVHDLRAALRPVRAVDAADHLAAAAAEKAGDAHDLTLADLEIEGLYRTPCG